MPNKKKYDRNVFIVLIICGIIYLCLLYKNVHDGNELKNKYKNNLLMLKALSEKFDYLQGLYMIPIGIFFVVLLDYLGLPSYKDAYYKIKKDFKKKMKEF